MSDQFHFGILTCRAARMLGYPACAGEKVVFEKSPDGKLALNICFGERKIGTEITIGELGILEIETLELQTFERDVLYPGILTRRAAGETGSLLRAGDKVSFSKSSDGGTALDVFYPCGNSQNSWIGTNLPIGEAGVLEIAPHSEERHWGFMTFAAARDLGSPGTAGRMVSFTMDRAGGVAGNIQFEDWNISGVVQIGFEDGMIVPRHW